MATFPRYRGRFAPSPTGPLHFGSLIAAVASYADARAHGGEWLLRIEDVDLQRSRTGASDALLATLHRHGLAWDGEVVYQSERNPLYSEALDRLGRQDRVFACTCSRKDLAAAPIGVSGEPIYPGICRDLHRVAGAGARACAIRVRVDDEPITFVDRLRGAQQQSLARDVGDFVIKRNDGLFAYQLAVVVDDAEQQVTHVVRGADLLTSTPRQIWLQRKLGLSTPSYLHHAVAIDVRGAKLSKEAGAAKLPDEALPSLIRAWRFLGQAMVPASVSSVADFWRWASGAWNVRMLPPVAALPAPVVACAPASSDDAV